MGIQLGVRKQHLLLKAHQHEIDEIFDMYWEIEKYQIHYQDGVIEKEKFRYPVSKIQEKFHLRSNIELVFLISRKGKHLGICQYCSEPLIEYQTRTSRNMSCNHIAKCIECEKAYDRGYGENGICVSCQYKNIKLSPNDIRDSYELLLYADYYEISKHCTDPYQLQKAIELLQERIIYFKQALHKLKAREPR